MASENYDILDLAKYVLSFFIVSIHTKLFPLFLYPWLRIAIPLFFIISSYLLFTKINQSPIECKKSIINKSIFRQIKLYAFWFVVLLPITIYYRQSWFDKGVINGVIISIRQILFSSTFVASWFITASIGAIWIISKISTSKNYRLLMILFSIIYIICCLRSSYFSEIKNVDIIKSICKEYEKILPNPVFSFPVALFWMMIGKLFADKKIDTSKHRIFAIMGILSCIMLDIEWKFVYNLNHSYGNDCYLFLAPLAIAIFALIKDIKIHIKNAKVLRKISTIMYPLHASTALVLRLFIKRFIFNQQLACLIVFIITLLFCHIVSLIIIKLSSKKMFSFLKYAY